MQRYVREAWTNCPFHCVVNHYPKKNSIQKNIFKVNSFKLTLRCHEKMFALDKKKTIETCNPQISIWNNVLG